RGQMLEFSAEPAIADSALPAIRAALESADALLEQYPVRTGSNTRWMSRLDDGTLLSLRPHG
ncbi:hypothetical protein ACPA2M_27155, partial [Ectopseudomonas chengduensis]